METIYNKYLLAMDTYMDKQRLKDIIIDQHAIRLPTPLVKRDSYIDMIQIKKSKQIIIVSGLRRSGKSVLLEQLRHEAIESDYYINFDDDRLFDFKLEDFQALYELFIELYGIQKTFYFDEIQNIVGWERFVRRLHDAGNKLYITGSNASMLSMELGTRLTGRYIEYHLYPYSFSEFLNYKKFKAFKTSRLTTIDKGTLKGAFSEFMNDGGLPEYLEQKYADYLHSLYESIIYRDVIVRYKITNHQAVKELVYYLASNLGKDCSFNSLKKTLGLASATTVSNYCDYLQSTFLCYFVHRYDDSLKKQLQYAKKIYFIDQALAVNIGFRVSQDQGRLLENIVFLELLRRGKDIYYHKDKQECDFVLREKTKITSAIQVCVSLDNDKTKAREIAGLVEAMEAYQLTTGLILTNDTSSQESIIVNEKRYQITILPVWLWCLS